MPKYTKPRRIRVTKDHREATYASKYGLSVAEVEHLKSLQNYQCAICQRSAPLVIDHCHITGLRRGLLCRNCNLGLGQFRDNLASLERAMEYLKVNSGIHKVAEESVVDRVMEDWYD